MTEVIIIAIVAGFVAAGAVCFGVVSKYKSGLHAPIYPLEHYTKLDLMHHTDRFLHRHVTKVKVASSSSKKK